MAEQVWDLDTVGYGTGDTLGSYFDFYVNNTFYLLAPPYYYTFYSTYLRRCLMVYDGWFPGWHNKAAGLVPEKMLQSVARGLNNTMFAHGVDFGGSVNAREFAKNWNAMSNFYRALKKAHLFALSGGTSLLKINRIDADLWVSAHRIDTFYADYDVRGKITRCLIYYDALSKTTPSETGVDTKHYGIFEERYYNDEGKPCARYSVYLGSSNLQTEPSARRAAPERVPVSSLPAPIVDEIKTYFPSILLDKEQYLPFYKTLGCYPLKATDDIGALPNTPLGQPIGDILFTESFQYDQMKYFEKNEVDLARARALLPVQFWNQDDPEAQNRSLSQRFYQKVGSLGDDKDKITPIQFMLRGNDIRAEKENIYKDVALKLNVSASSIASFLSEGEGAKTATEIVNERTKTDTWIGGQINLISPEVDELLYVVCRYYNREPATIILRPENQSPFLETVKILGDQLSAGNITPRLFVTKVFKDMSIDEQEREIAVLEKARVEAPAAPLGLYAKGE